MNCIKSGPAGLFYHQHQHQHPVSRPHQDLVLGVSLLLWFVMLKVNRKANLWRNGLEQMTKNKRSSVS